jgi:two-component system LytT family sensor kinase
MDMDQGNAQRGVRHEVALYTILGFWLFYIAVVTARAAVMDFPAQGELALRRVAVTVLGIVLTYILYLFLRQVDHKPLATRIAAAFIGAVPCAVAIAAFNYYVFNVYDPASLIEEAELLHDAEQGGRMLKEIAEVALSRYFFLIAWATLYLAISYASEVRIAERRAASFARAAQDAELRSLRYQVNPHFLFNTLNSLSSLVMTQRTAEAEAMILNLSTFYRTSLSGDPLDDVTLAEEVRLQRLYLAIEAVRFPERLITEIDIPEALTTVCVPGLILQPLVENAIKYGVSTVSRPVRLSITARAEAGVVTLVVADDGNGPAEGVGHGGGIGLANVRDRLAARFGTAARIETDAPAGGGFRVILTFPEVHGGC